MRINNLVDTTAQKFVRVVNFVSVDFGLSESFQLSVVVVNMVQLVEFLTEESSVSNNSKSLPAVSSIEGAGRVVDSGDGGSKGLGLGGGPVLALVRLGHRLVGHLSSSTVHGGSVDGGMDHGSSVDHGGSMNNGSGMDHGSGMVDGTGNSNGVGNSVGNGDGLGVGSLAVVGDGGDVSLDVVGSVGDVLGAAVREGDGVRSSPGSGAVVSLLSLEVGAGVVVSNGVLELVGGDLVRVHLGNGVGNRSMVGRGGVNDRGSMDNRGSVDDRAGNSVGNAMANNSVGNAMANNSMGKSSSQKLRGGRGRGHQGNTQESLHFC